MTIFALASLGFLAINPHGNITARGAFVGTVCVASSGTTGCPSAPVVITGPTSGTVTIAIDIAGSDSLGGAAVSVKTDPTVLNPVSISSTGTVVPGSTFTLINCINGAPQAGTTQCNSWDGVGVASLGILSFGQATVPPTTGLVFTITYSVVTTTTGTPITFLNNPGCAGQSITGTNDCVQITVGSAVVPETDQAAAFANLATFSLSAGPTSSQIKAGQSGTSTITAKGFIGFAGTITLVPTINSTAAGHPIPSVNPTSITLSTTITSGTSTLTVPTSTGSQAGTYNVTVTGTGLSQIRAVSFILKVVATPALATILSNNPIIVGSSVSDSATLSAASTSPAGFVTYTLFSASGCTGTPQLISTVTVTAGVVPSMKSIPINGTGTVSFNVTYNGDYYDQSASTCEQLTVNKASPSISTTLTPSTITVGTSASDSAIITGGFFGPATGTPFSSTTGTVTYNLFTSNTCTGPSKIISNVNVNGNTGAVPASRLVLFNSTGTFAWNATYSGDSNNNKAQSLCEFLTVQPVSPTVTTNLSPNNIGVGGSASDTATLAGGYNPTGTVTYYLFVDGTGGCTGTSHVVSVVTVSTNGVQTSSRAVTFNNTLTQTFGWNATYSGDLNNNKRASVCELLVVTATPDFSISSSISSLPSFQVGTTSTTTATITILSINLFQGSVTLSNSTSPFAGVAVACSVNIVPVTPSTPGTSVCTFKALSAGSFTVTITGKSTSPVVATHSIIPAISVIATKATSALASALSTNTITLNSGTQTATDTATLSGTYFATQTILFQVFGPGDAVCSGTPQTLSTLPVSGNGGYTPSAFTPIRGAGTYEFVASYSGDGNNTSFSTPCTASLQILTVNKAISTISTQLFNATSNTPLALTGGVAIVQLHGTVYTSFFDSASISGGFSVTGSVTYDEYNGFSCSGTPHPYLLQIGNGVVPHLTASVLPAFPAGNYSFSAFYGGDGNNTATPASACEPLTVNAIPVAIFTATSQTTVFIVGNTVNFNATASHDPDASILKDTLAYTWNFGEGTPIISFSATATHTYNNIGTYTATLTVTDLYGGQSITSETIQVINPSVSIVSAKLSTNSATIGDTVTLTVDILNNGSVPLTFNVTMTVNGQTVDQQQITLQPGQENNAIVLHWITAGFAVTSYTVSAQIVGTTTNGTLVPISTSSQGAGNLALQAQQNTFPLPGGADTWIIIGAVAAVAIVSGIVLLRRRKTVSV